eukprot:TRINITY_DN15249_c0_g1_i1.p1 TRINITY_DN15249_c0_g1~~TRINITY_DN15249_c0_g1_i1.p1  ORF type:complete len:144 (-),score=11.51 TRINITY_DN15249_c0_g1_i1:36-467(-)
MPADPCAGKNEGDTCDDLSACTTDTTCQSGVCKGTSIDCGCFECDFVSGCTTTPATNGTECNDNDMCTQVDTCQSGVCIGSSPVICSAEECFTSSCNSTTGQCQASPIVGCDVQTPNSRTSVANTNGLYYATFVLLMVGAMLG